MDAVRDALVHAIQKGVPAYNGGAPHICRDIYAAAARGVVDARIAPQHVADALRCRRRVCVCGMPSKHANGCPHARSVAILNGHASVWAHASTWHGRQQQ
eukprot:352986-Chlamydomonas_euryale.AAC.16